MQVATALRVTAPPQETLALTGHGTQLPAGSVLFPRPFTVALALPHPALPIQQSPQAIRVHPAWEQCPAWLSPFTSGHLSGAPAAFQTLEDPRPGPIPALCPSLGFFVQLRESEWGLPGACQVSRLPRGVRGCSPQQGWLLPSGTDQTLAHVAPYPAAPCSPREGSELGE